MTKLPSGPMNQFTSKSGLSGDLVSSGNLGGLRSKKRRHQKAPRLCPIILEPLEQRQLLTALPVDPLAASSGSSIPAWFTVYGGSNMASQVITDHALQTVSLNTVSGATSYVFNSVSTTNSVQQQSVQIDDGYYAGTTADSAQFGLQARTNSNNTNFYAMETSLFSKTGNGSISIVKSDAGTVTTLATYNLNTVLSPAAVIQYQDDFYSPNNIYNMKFLVQTDSGNTSLTDLKAEIWQNGTAEPTAWQLATTDGDTNLQGAGNGGILEIPSSGSGKEATNLVNGYAQSTTGDPATITNFTSNTTDYTGSYPVTATFNASATYAHGTISSYSINFGDGTTPVTTSAVVNLTHSYTAAPAQAFIATLTVTDSTGGTSLAQQDISANTSVSTDPTGALTMDRMGGNGISASNPLLVHFQTTGTPHSGDSLASYILNFGDGTYLDMPIPSGSGTSTLSINTNHLYTTTGTMTPTLILVGNDGATTIVNDATAPQPTLLISSTSPTVAISFNTSTNKLTAVFSEDVGVALVGQVDGNDAALGDKLWSDGATTAGSIANDLDIRTDSTGASLSLTGDTFSYNASNFTATWSLGGVTGFSPSTVSYTARLFSNAIEGDPGTGIQDQAGNDLDGINSGIGGEDATQHFGHTYTTPTVTLATSGVWNTAMPLVFAPSVVPNDIQSLSVASGDTTITFTGNSTNKKILDDLLPGGFAGGAVIVEDMAAGFTALDGLWSVTAVTATNTTDTVTIAANPYTQTQLNAWVAGASGSMHISPYYDTTADNSSYFSIESALITNLDQIIGGTINFATDVTGATTEASAVYVGETSQFDSNTTTDPEGYNKVFDNETALGLTGYIINSNGNNLYIVGGGDVSGANEQNAIDAFLQSLGMQVYGPANTDYTSSNTTAANIWQITPSYSNATGLTGSWDIRQTPVVGYLNDTNDDGGNLTETVGWDNLYALNFGGGGVTDFGGGGLGQQGNLGFGATQTSVDAHPDWWSSGTGVSLSSVDYVATFMPLGTVTSGDTFSATLKSGSTFETVSVTANSTDNSPSGIVSALYTAIFNDTTDTFFESTSIVVLTNSDYNTNGPLTLSSTTNPVVEIYDKHTNTPVYKVSSLKNGLPDPNFPTDVYHDSQINYANPGVYNHVATGYVSNFINSAPSGSFLTLSPKDGPGYDQSPSTLATMHSNNPFLTGAIETEWQGYNQNGVFVDAVSESYWTLVNELAQYVLQNEGSKVLFVDGLTYASTSNPPSFPLEPNVLIISSQILQGETPDTIDEQVKINGNHGGMTGVYLNWGIYLETGYNNPDAPDFQPSILENNFALYNDDHTFALEGENAASVGADMPGALLAGQLTNNPATANATTMQNVLTNYYNGLYGPASVNMEDYTVLFDGSAADPNLASPPAQMSFDGLAFGAFGEPVGNFGQPNPVPDFNTVVSDNLALQQSYGYLDAASSTLSAALANSSITSTQYNTYQARVDQMRMYNHYMFLEYKVESDYFGLGTNTTPAINSANFNLILNDLDNVAIWVNALVSTNLVNASNIDGSGGFVPYTYAALKYFVANDPNGSNGITTANKGLLTLPGQKANPSQATLNSYWSNDEAILVLPAAPTNLAATIISSTENDLTWTNNAASPDTQTGLNIYRSTNDVSFSLLTSVSASATTYHDTTVTSGPSYWYEIQSFNTSGNSIFNGPAEATSPANSARAIQPQRHECFLQPDQPQLDRQ